MISDYVMDGPSALLPLSSQDGKGPWLQSKFAIEWHRLSRDPSEVLSLYELPGMLSDAVDEPLGPVIRKAVWKYRQDYEVTKTEVLEQPNINVELFSVPAASLQELEQLMAAMDQALPSFPFLSSESVPLDDSKVNEAGKIMVPVSYRLAVTRDLTFGSVKLMCETRMSSVFDRAVLGVRDFMESLCVSANAATDAWTESWLPFTPETYGRLLSSVLRSDP